MRSKKSLLILIAQPAYETILFFEGINRLRHHFNIDVLCFTFSAATEQGKELLRVAGELGIKVFFQNAIDQGENSLLLNVDNKLRSTLKSGYYDAVITHPPYDGDSPHPYHVQCFHVARRLCAQMNIAFGFFSDKKIESVEIEKNLHVLDLRRQFLLFVNYVKYHLKIRKYPLKNLAEINSELQYFLHSVLHRRKYALLSFYPNMFEKQSVLDQYKSQLHSLISFKNYVNTVEYLYLEQYPNSGTLESIEGRR